MDYCNLLLGGIFEDVVVVVRVGHWWENREVLRAAEEREREVLVGEGFESAMQEREREREAPSAAEARNSAALVAVAAAVAAAAAAVAAVAAYLLLLRRRRLGIISTMKTETKIQIAMAIIGIPLTLFVVWQPNAKWPNPWREPAAKKRPRMDSEY